MSLTSQFALLERETIRKAGVPVVLRVQFVVTVDFTTPKGTITRDSYEQELSAIPGNESSSKQGFTRTFRCLLDDLPTDASTEFKILYQGLVYTVEKYTTGRVSAVLHCSRP